MTRFTTDGTGSVLDEEGYEICYVHGTGSFEENKKVAVLFSSAPKLLKALQNIINHNCPNSQNHDCNCAYEAGKLAIAEALGEQ